MQSSDINLEFSSNPPPPPEVENPDFSPSKLCLYLLFWIDRAAPCDTLFELFMLDSRVFIFCWCLGIPFVYESCDWDKVRLIGSSFNESLCSSLHSSAYLLFTPLPLPPSVSNPWNNFLIGILLLFAVSSEWNSLAISIVPSGCRCVPKAVNSTSDGCLPLKICWMLLSSSLPGVLINRSLKFDLRCRWNHSLVHWTC